MNASFPGHSRSTGTPNPWLVENMREGETYGNWVWAAESPRGATDQDGRVAKSAAQSSVGLKYLYASRPWSPVAEAYHNRARWYSPEAARFLTRDPIGYLGGVNQYMYAGGNPIGFRDPWGLRGEDGKDLSDFLKGALSFFGNAASAAADGAEAAAKAAAAAAEAAAIGSMIAAEEVAGKVWASPNTAAGIVFGVTGTVAGTGMHVVGQGPMPRVSIGNNAIEFHNNPLINVPGISMGNAISYGPHWSPNDMIRTYNGRGFETSDQRPLILAV